MISKELAIKLKDKEWRVNNLYKIVDKKAQTIKFKRNEAQEHFNQNKHTRNLILKSRQLGFTTDECIDTLDDTLWTKNFKSIFISYDKDSAVEIFDDKIKYAWDKYPEELRKGYKLDSDRANKLKFDFGEETYSSLLVRTKGRSGTFQRGHISEFAKICKESPRKAKEIIRGTIPAVTDGGRLDIESTAEGEEGEFHDMFWDAWNRGEPTEETEFKAHFYNWQWERKEIEKIEPIPTSEMIDGYKFEEYREKLKERDNIDLTDKELTFYYRKWLSLNKNWDALMQEYPTTPEEAFVSSGNKLFDRDSVDKLKKYVTEGERVGKWIYYESYKVGHRYALGADVSHGKGKDSSTIVIMDFFYPKPKVVAEYESNTTKADMFAYEVRNGGRAYGNCIVAVENNDRGHTTLTTLKGIYNNIYKRVNEKQKQDKQTDDLGWNTNIASKPKMMLELSTAIDEDLLDIPSKYIQTELRTYSEDDLSQIRFDDEQTRHWDRIIALAICFQMKTKAMRRGTKFPASNNKKKLI